MERLEDAESGKQGELTGGRLKGPQRPEIALRIAHIKLGAALGKGGRASHLQRTHDVPASGAGSFEMLTDSRASAATKAIEAMPTRDQGFSAGGRLETNTTPVRQTRSPPWVNTP